MFIIKFKGDQPSNIGNIQEFQTIDELNNWIDTILSLNILREFSLSDDEAIFVRNDGYAGTAEIIKL